LYELKAQIAVFSKSHIPITPVYQDMAAYFDMIAIMFHGQAAPQQSLRDSTYG
jgi:hypothetical protein